MRPEVGLADLVRAIDQLGVDSGDEARAIAELLEIRATEAAPTSEGAVARGPERSERARRRQKKPRGKALPPEGLNAGLSPNSRSASQDAGQDTLTATQELARREPAPSTASTEQFTLGDAAAAGSIGFLPLIDPRLARSIVGALISAEHHDGPVDLAAAVATIARRRPLTCVPRRKCRTLRFGAQLLVDVGAGMEMYELDALDLQNQIHKLVGADQLEVLCFVGPGAPITLESNSHEDAPKVRARTGWSLYQFPAPKTPVLALSDLGFARGGLHGQEEARWITLATTLASLGSSLIILTPGPRDRWPTRLASVATLVQWDRATVRNGRPTYSATSAPAVMPGVHETRTSQRAGHPDVFALARLVALTARCEPRLLRWLRRRFLPATEAWIEGALWASPLAEVRARSGLMLRADVTRVLVDSWHNDPKLPAVTEEIAKAHAEESSFVRMHEVLAANLARGPDDAVGMAHVRRLLGGVAASIATGPKTRLLDWTRHVLRRLPDRLDDPTVFHLAIAVGDARNQLVGSGSHDPTVLRSPIVGREPAALSDRGAPLADDGPRREIGIYRTASTAVFSTTTQRGVRIAVPSTYPAVLTVYRLDHDPIVVSVADDPVEIEWKAGPLEVYALDGRGWRLTLGAAPSPSVEAPWSSLVWIPPPPEFAFGYVVTPRAVAAPIEAVVTEAPEPINVRLAGVTVQARLLLADRQIGVAILALGDQTAVPPLAKAVVEGDIADGVLALEFGAATSQPIHARITDDTVRVGPVSVDIVAGMAVVADGELAGMLGAPVEGEDYAFRLIRAEVIEDAEERGFAQLAGLAELTQLIARSDAQWVEIGPAASAIVDRITTLAVASVDAFAQSGGTRRSAALLVWARSTPSCAVRHALAALETAERNLDIEIALHALTRLVRSSRLDGPHARRARRRLDTIAPVIQDPQLREHIEELRATLKSVEGAHHELKLERHALARFHHRDSMELVQTRLQLRLRALVISGGIDGATRLAIASRLHQVAPGYLVLAWTFRGGDVETFCAFAAGALGLQSSATLLAVARRAAELDANVLLDRVDRWSADRDDVFAQLQAFARPFIALGRGHCIFTCRGSVPDLGPGDAWEVVKLSGFPVEPEFRVHLSISLEYKANRIDSWTRGLVVWGPVAAVAAIIYAVIDSLPRWYGPGEQGADAFLSALRSWIDQPGQLTTAQRAVLANPAKKRGRLDRIAALLGSAVALAEVALDGKPVDEGQLCEELSGVVHELESVAHSTIQASVRRAYLGAGHLREDFAEFVIAFDRPIEGQGHQVATELESLVSDRVEQIDIVDEPDKLAFSVRPMAFKQIRGAWRAGRLTTLTRNRLRWFAESNPFPMHDDLQKGHWGGLPERGKRIATASVSEPEAGWYTVRIQVTAMPDAPPLRGTVRFHLHDTCPDPVVDVLVRRGVAELTHEVWGAFTVGIECDRGETQLEIDLADIPNADPEFLEENKEGESSMAVASYGVDLPLREGVRWRYHEDLGTRVRVERQVQTMTVKESIAHDSGVTTSLVGGFIGRASDTAASSLWLITRGDGRYFAVPAERSVNVRMRKRADKLQDLLVAEHLFLRFPMRAGSSFANKHCQVQVRDVRFTTLRIRGIARSVVVYDIIQRWPHSQVRLSVAPGVGLISATDHDGTSWQLMSYAERQPSAASESPSRQGKRRKRARR